MPADEVSAFPERIGRFELLLPIGTGGMGSVYLGRVEVTPGLFHDVAIKLMHPQLRADPDVAGQLLHEARVAAGIVHPHVVRVHEAGEGPHGVYMAMDYVEGATLSGLLRTVLGREESVPLPIAGRILCDALTGLHAAHELKAPDGKSLEIIHRDFSPQNILVGLDGSSRLADFGIAKVVGDLGGTATGIVKGKVGYMSPEQARGEPIDRRCDVWAAGVVAWETIAGQRLFRAANDAATLLMIVSGAPPPSLRARRAEVSGTLEACVMSALDPRLDRRPSTAAAFREQLEAAFLAEGGLADADEVGDFVRSAVGVELDRRRTRASSVAELRGQIARVSAAAERRARLESSASLEPFPATDPTPAPVPAPVTSPPIASAAPSPPRRWWSYGVVAIAVAGVAAIVTFGVDGTATSGADPARPNASAAIQPEAATPAAAGASLAAGREELRLRLRADDPIAQLRIGDRNIAFTEPVRQVEVPLTAAERDVILDISAIAEDGRRHRLSVEPGQREVEFAFPVATAAPTPPAKPAAVAPKPPLSPPPSALDKGPGLADSPYNKPK